MSENGAGTISFHGAGTVTSQCYGLKFSSELFGIPFTVRAKDSRVKAA